MLATKPKIAIVVSSPMTARVFLRDQLNNLVDTWDVTLLANFEQKETKYEWLDERITVVDISIQRTINIVADIRALFRLKRIFSENKYVLVHSVSPKAGLLSMCASWMARVPVRIHTFTGQVWATKIGVKQTIFKLIDKVTAKMSTKVLVDSNSQREFLLDCGVVTRDKSLVLAEGSISGVDTNRFVPDADRRDKIRATLGTANNTLVLLFVGRLKKEKGIYELVEAFCEAKQSCTNLELWLVGPDEEDVTESVISIDGIKLNGFTSVPEHYMCAADVLCLPSYREGFGSVVIEAAACGIPTIGSNIYGLTDAIVDGGTGVLVPPKDKTSLTKSIVSLYNDRENVRKMGQSALLRANSMFSQHRITKEIIQLYENLTEPTIQNNLGNSEQ